MRSHPAQKNKRNQEPRSKKKAHEERPLKMEASEKRRTQKDSNCVHTSTEVVQSVTFAFGQLKEALAEGHVDKSEQH